MKGSILFTAKYGKNMEKDIKEWRTYSYYLGNIAVYIELTTALRPQYFIIIASLSNTCI